MLVDGCEYFESTPLEQRNYIEIYRNLDALFKHYYRQVLQGYVLDWRSLEVNNLGIIDIDAIRYIRPSSSIEDVNLASKVKQYLSEFQEGFGRKSRSSYLLAPELKDGTHDYRSDIYGFAGLLVCYYSNFQFNESDDIQLILSGDFDSFDWKDKQKIVPFIEKCLRLNPFQRLSLDRFLENWRKSVKSISEPEKDELGKYYDYLNSHKQALIDVGSKSPYLNFKPNKAILLGEEAKEVNLEMKWVFDREESNPTKTRLQRLLREEDLAVKTRGFSTLKIAFLFLNWTPENTTIKSPVLIKNARLQKIKSFKDKYSLLPENSYWQVNEVLSYYILGQTGKQLPLEVKASEIECFVTDLSDLLANSDVGDFTIERATYLYIFPQPSMSLLKDFDFIMAQSPNALLEKYRNSSQKINKSSSSSRYEFSSQLHRVLPTDPSQEKSLVAINEESIVMEGPPGTGKSHTIVNALSQELSRGHRVLFVSEKKAALDVVYKKLEESNLADMALLVHDQIKERSRVVRALKEAYKVLNEPFGAEYFKECSDLGKQKVDLFNQFQKEIFDQKERASPIEVFKKRNKKPLIAQKGEVPTYSVWKASEKDLISLFDHLATFHGLETWRSFVFSDISLGQLLAHENPSSHFKICINELILKFKQLKKLSKIYAPFYQCDFKSVYQVFGLIRSFRPLWEKKNIKLLLELNPNLAKFESIKGNYQKKKITYQALVNGLNEEYLASINIQELELAIEKHTSDPEVSDTELRQYIDSFVKQNKLQFVKDESKLLKNALRIKKLEQELEILKLKGASLVNHQNFEVFISELSYAQDLMERLSFHFPWFKAALEEQRFPDIFLRNLDEFFDIIISIDTDLNLFSDRVKEKDLTALSEFIICFNNIDFSSKRQLSSQMFHDLPIDLQTYLCDFDECIEALEQRVLSREVELLGQSEHFQRFNDVHWNDFLNQRQIDLHNSRTVCVQQLRKTWQLEFSRLIDLLYKEPRHCDLSEKKQRRAMKIAQRIFKREFSKKTRHLSLRELHHAESNELISKIKPILLMSPNSASEVLPCRAESIDLVIFDEASQLNFAHVIPILFRAKKVLVVGDGQQLTPSSFFEKRYVNSPDYVKSSLLHESTFCLSSYSLSWHYRSENPWLIQFSNTFFYQNSLRVIPAFSQVTSCMEYYYLVNGSYVNRTNRHEAEQLIKRFAEIIKTFPQSTFAILALSISQQQELENSLERLRLVDMEFDDLLELENVKIKNGVFEGLVIRNLENIQGEERDFVFISTGYGRDSDGKLRQQFGPINQQNGANRLNVLISRARIKMLVFTSLNPSELSLEQNNGIWCLKQFLKYASAVSTNNEEEIKRILHNLNPKLGQEGKKHETDNHEDLAQLLNSKFSGKNWVPRKDITFVKGLKFFEEKGSMGSDLLAIQTSVFFADEISFLLKNVLKRRGFKVTYLHLMDLYSENSRNSSKILLD